MKTSRLRSLPLTAIILIITGLFWILSSLSSESSLHTLGVGLISLAAGGLMLKGFVSGYSWSFYTAASLYNLILFAYMAYASSILIQIGLVSIGVVSTVGYLLAAAIYLIITLKAFYRPSYSVAKSD
ncbi:MAG: hypothetical protein QXW32_00495 [Nitrososphaerales archaeon]